MLFRSVGADQPLLGTDATNLDGTGAQVDVVEVEPGTQIYGSFQLRFGGETTGPLDYDASADDVKHALDALISIAPSQVAVTRDGPMTTGPANGKAGTSTQVGGYVWSITFASNGWRDPTADHTSDAGGAVLTQALLKPTCSSPIQQALREEYFDAPGPSTQASTSASAWHRCAPALAAAVEEAFSSVRREAPATEVGGDLDAALEGPGVPVPARVLTTSVDLCSQDIVREF